MTANGKITNGTNGKALKMRVKIGYPVNQFELPITVPELPPVLERAANSTYHLVPQFSRSHGQVPRLYVQEWKTDMKNRELIIKNAELGGVPHYEHDENLFLDKREQMFYNTENRNRVDGKCKMPDREVLLRPQFHHETSRYQSELMFRRDTPLA